MAEQSICLFKNNMSPTPSCCSEDSVRSFFFFLNSTFDDKKKQKQDKTNVEGQRKEITLELRAILYQREG